MENYTFWFCPGSVDLYGEKEINTVTEHCKEIVAALNNSPYIPYEVVLQPTLLSTTNILSTFKKANEDKNCAGVIAWMHMFSPAKSWIAGLSELKKPLLHLHTQYNDEIPYDTIDMDFININQSAHGDREFAYMLTRMDKPRKTVVGFWKDPAVQEEIGAWMRTAVGVVKSRGLKIMRLADNMKNVADTEGDKLEAQLKLGWTVDTYPIAEAVKYVNSIDQSLVDELTDEYYKIYKIDARGRDEQEFKKHVAEQARLELGLEKMLTEEGYDAIVTHFGDLEGLNQLPGLAIQRLMEKGYGFAAEGDWKTAGLVRLVKDMTKGLKDAKGASFMEDYTYNLAPGKEGVLETHMLEICPSIAEGDVSIRVEPLVLGAREDPARLVFTAKQGPAVAATLIDMGDRFRLIINDVDVKKTEKPMPNLPVASAYWVPKPDFKNGVQAWLMAGGAHHNVMTYDLTAQQLADWANEMGIETVIIDADTDMRRFNTDLMLGALLYKK